MTWVPPTSVDDFYYGRLPFVEAEEVFNEGGALTGDTRDVTVGWHGTFFDEERGMFGIVRTGGPLEDWVGERVLITYDGGEVNLIDVTNQDVAALPGSNVLFNSSFESVSDGIPVGYTASQAELVSSVQSPLYGKRMARILPAAGATGVVQLIGEPTTAGAGGVVILPGRNYTVSAWVRGPIGGMVNIGFREQDVSGTLAGEPRGIGTTLNDWAVLTGEWQRIWLAGQPQVIGSGTTVKVGIEVNFDANYISAGDVFDIDGVQIEQAEAPTPYAPQETDPPPVVVAPPERTIVVYVHDESANMDEDISLTRRAYLSLQVPGVPTLSGTAAIMRTDL